MRRLLFAAILALAPGLANAVGYVTGTITRVHAGPDTWYGVRFYLTITNNQANGECDPEFVYVEPAVGAGHKEKVAVFLSAYLAGKTVQMTVESGLNGHCRLVEGSMY